MSALDKEIKQLEETIRKNVRDLVEKYVSITTFDIPENDEQEATKRVLKLVKDELSKVEESIK